jgi:uncharacterized membrane protein
VDFEQGFCAAIPAKAEAINVYRSFAMRAKAHIGSHPVHPILVSFPIGLWIASFLFDLLGKSTGNIYLHIAAYYALIGGCIGAVLAAIPGVIDLFGAVPPRSSARKRGYIHGALNTLALLLFAYIAIRRGDPMVRPDNASLLLSFLGVIGIGISGWLGGTLVFRGTRVPAQTLLDYLDDGYAPAREWHPHTFGRYVNGHAHADANSEVTPPLCTG